MSHELWALIGVIIGGAIASFTPIVTYRLERRKRKKDVKKELIQSVYEFFNQLKFVHKFQGNHYYHMLRGNALNTWSVENPTSFNAKKAGIDRESDWESAKNYDEKSNITSDQLIKLESQIHALLIDIEDHYGYNTYQATKRILEPEIEKSNDGHYFLEFEKMQLWSLEDFHKGQVEFDKGIVRKAIEIQKLCDQTIKRIRLALK